MRFKAIRKVVFDCLLSVNKIFVLFLLFIALRTATSAETPWQFHGPFGLAVNSKDVIYVAEIDSARVSKFTAEGEWLGTIASVEGYGALKGPFDVTIGPNDWIYINDTRNHKVIVLDSDEKLQFVIGADTKGAAPGMFSEPHFTAVNARGEIFVSDTFNARVQKFSPTGDFIKAWGRIGDKPGEFLYNGYVGGIACDNKGHVYLRESDGGRIQKFTEDGNHVATFCKRGTAPGELDEGYGCDVIGDVLWVADTFESRIQKFSLDGKLLNVWAPGEGNTGSHFNHPVAIASTSKGDLIVTDWKNNRVVKLNSGGEFVQTWGKSLEDLLAYEPPARVPRKMGRPIVFGAYAGLSDSDLQACQRSGIRIVYPSFENQDGEWGIEEVVKKAAAMGLEVHPSIAMFGFGQRSEFSRTHQKFRMWKKGGTGPVGDLLAWSHPETRSFRADHLVQQARRTGVQGIMLDYIRYLGNDYGYEPAVLQAYEQKYGVDPSGLATNDPQWMQFRANDITKFIVELRHKLADLDDPLEVSAYLGPADPKAAIEQSLQDWGRWARMGIVDKLHVAPYTRDFERIYNDVRQVRAAVPDGTKINLFLACYGGNLNTPALLKKGIEVGVAAGADEITIYRSDAIWELKLWDAIKEAIENTNAGR